MRQQIYLSKRNLLTLLSKLERLEHGDETACAIVKYANPADPYCNTIKEVMVIAVPDEKFYTNRAPGAMHPLDETNMQYHISNTDNPIDFPRSKL
jgi:hypothetical protein